MSERVIEWISLSLNILSHVLFPPHAELVGWLGSLRNRLLFRRSGGAYPGHSPVVSMIGSRGVDS